jgi:hypothetical protein
MKNFIQDIAADVRFATRQLIKTPAFSMTKRPAFFAFIALALACLSFDCSRQLPIVETPDTLPLRLTDQEFWTMMTDFSEASGTFPSDNFVSNESGY